MMIKIGLITASLFLAATAAVSAASSFERRQSSHLDAIEEGRRGGEITWREGLALRREQREISALESRFLSDGRLDKRERRILRARQHEAEENIWSEANDSRRRPFWLPRVGR